MCLLGNILVAFKVPTKSNLYYKKSTTLLVEKERTKGEVLKNASGVDEVKSCPLPPTDMAGYYGLGKDP